MCENPFRERVRIEDKSPCGVFACSPCASMGSLRVLSGFSGFLPPSKNMHVTLTGYSKLTQGVRVSVDGCYRLIQGVRCLPTNLHWIENGWLASLRCIPTHIITGGGTWSPHPTLHFSSRPFKASLKMIESALIGRLTGHTWYRARQVLILCLRRRKYLPGGHKASMLLDDQVTVKNPES